MTVGRGKYDDLCTYVREQAGVMEGEGAAVVIVMGGKHGHGFSVQADLLSAVALPDLLEAVARQMRRDIAG